MSSNAVEPELKMRRQWAVRYPTGNVEVTASEEYARIIAGVGRSRRVVTRLVTDWVESDDE